MEELKTLKDLQFTAIEDKNKTYQQGFIDGNKDFFYKIRAEAVKWRKKFTLEYPINIDDWNEFFNLTEEDLK